MAGPTKNARLSSVLAHAVGGRQLLRVVDQRGGERQLGGPEGRPEEGGQRREHEHDGRRTVELRRRPPRRATSTDRARSQMTITVLARHPVRHRRAERRHDRHQRQPDGAPDADGRRRRRRRTPTRRPPSRRPSRRSASPASARFSRRRAGRRNTWPGRSRSPGRRSRCWPTCSPPGRGDGPGAARGERPPRRASRNLLQDWPTGCPGRHGDVSGISEPECARMLVVRRSPA